MASTSLISALLLLSLFTTPSLGGAGIPPSTPVEPSAACNSTLDPQFCRSILPPSGSCHNDDLFDYGRLSLAKSLTNAQTFRAMISGYLSDHHSDLTPTAVFALEDCLLLSGLNIDFLTSAGATLNSTDYLADAQAGNFQAILSALITNHQTCFDGLKATASAWSITKSLAVPLRKSSKIYSVSLALYNQAWIGKRKLQSRSSSSGRTKVIPFVPKERRILLQSSDTILVYDIVVVSKDGRGDFATVNAAVNAAPANLDGIKSGYFLIYIVAGIYNEYVTIPKNKKYLMMIGDGIGRTVITGNHSVKDGWTTFNSATFALVGQGFVGINITFRNTAGAAKGQAVAARIGGDLATFYSCSFEGYQDTLYAHSLRQFYKQCNIYGTVDFIFGNAAAVFQACNIYARLPLRGQSDVVTAQSRSDPNQDTGTVFQGCKFIGGGDLKSSPLGRTTKTYLGRPWQNYSRVVIMQSYMEGHVTPAGWSPWTGSTIPSTVYYAEYGNFGPGSDTAGRVKWPGFYVLNRTAASKFTVNSFLLGDNWLSQIGVPYTNGMLW